VLGIHDLPGGFGPWILAPVNALVPVGGEVEDASAVLIEPLAAALHAVQTIDPQHGETIAVLGPRRLGMLVVAALQAFRADTRRAFTILALSRRDALLELAGALGADRTIRVDGDGAALGDRLADVVIDTTGNPEGLALAVRLARREVHLKSTHGRPAVGLRHLTELVVDELAVRPAGEDGLDMALADAGPIAWLASSEPPAGLASRVVRGRGPELMAGVVAAAGGGLPRAGVAVVQDAAQVADAIRPGDVTPYSVVRPRGAIAVLPGAGGDSSPLLRAVVERGLRLTSSRCGDLFAAAAMLERDPALRRVGERMVTHWFGPDRMNDAFTTARSAACIKAVVRQPERA
jgi:threonine dehydrogenase-like Zn-dependent dehydrogenase